MDAAASTGSFYRVFLDAPVLLREGSSAEMRGVLRLDTVQLRAEHRGADDVAHVRSLVRRGVGTRSSLCRVQAARGVLRAEPHGTRDEHDP